MKQDKNYIPQMWVMLLLSMLILIGMYYLPREIFGWEIKPVDILAQIRSNSSDSLSALGEALSIDPKQLIASKSHRKDSNHSQEPTGDSQNKIDADSLYRLQLEASGQMSDSTFVPIEDYTDGHTALEQFSTAILNRNQAEQPVRIAVLGDSFIEGDIFTDPLRRLLQSKYGGEGVGWLPLSSQTAGFRSSIKHEFDGWIDKSVLDASKTDQTFTGHYYTGRIGAWAKYTLQTSSKPFSQANIYYTSTGDGVITTRLSDTTYTQSFSASSGVMEQIKLPLESPTSSIHITLDTAPMGFRLYGVALEGNLGVSLDNMSLRGNSGVTLTGISEVLSTRFCALRQYDLIILQYGLNVANDKQKDYSYYAKILRNAIAKLRRVSPRADILIMSVSDRAKRTAQGFETMKSIVHLHEVQRQVAVETGCAFWSTLRAMRICGGIGLMASKGKAAKDYTHLTHKGGVDIAQYLMKALEAEINFRVKRH